MTREELLGWAEDELGLHLGVYLDVPGLVGQLLRIAL